MELQLKEARKEHGEIPAMPVEQPVFIAGLARTGTTVLHRLLGCEPRLRPLLSWEGLTPAPLAGRLAYLPTCGLLVALASGVGALAPSWRPPAALAAFKTQRIVCRQHGIFDMRQETIHYMPKMRA